MNKLIEMIQGDAKVLNNAVVKVDSFLNHQMDVDLLDWMAKQIVDHFKDRSIDKVVTCEASGIGMAVMVAFALGVKVVFARKEASLILSEDCYRAPVYSYTKQKETIFSIDRRFIQEGERILLVDDFLANGQAMEGLVSIVQQGKAQVVGIGIAIEKGFQEGGRRLRQAGFEVYSLAIIDRIENNTCIFRQTH